MKTITILLATLLCLSAEARPSSASISADINQNWFDARSPLSKLEVVDSSVEVNLAQDFIELQFILPWTCPAGAACALVMPMRVFKVENIDIQVDECGTTLYVAQEDSRPVDGAFEKITVRDNTSNSCPTSMVMPHVKTIIEYEVKFFDRINGTEVEYTHIFNAEELK